MKILNIYFKNINSLEGEHRVDFEQAPFSDTGVFAITGPNGSGKSSLLDVITLGLYGETFRFDRPASHVMTRHTAASFATIVFSVAGERYQSSWQVKRVDNNVELGLMPPVMQLLRVADGEILADSPSSVCAKITEITGMNFRNFTRSILLAQGDFAAFLNALDSERMDILEKIISTDIYADYKQDITHKVEHAQQELTRLQQELAAIELLTPETQEAYHHDLIDFNEHLVELKQEQQDLQQQQALLMNVNALKRQIAEQEKSLEEAQAQLAHTQQLIDQIIVSQEALQFKGDLATHQQNHHALHQGKASFNELLQELKDLKSQSAHLQAMPDELTTLSLAEQQQALSEVKEKIAQFSLNSQSESAHLQTLQEQVSEKQAALATVSTGLDARAADSTLLSDFPEIGSLKKLRADLVDLMGKQKTFTKQAQKTTATFKNNATELSKEAQQQKEFDQQLKTTELVLADMAKGYSVEDLDSLKQDQQARVKDFQNLYKLALKYQQLTGKSGFFSFLKAKEPIDYDAEALTHVLEQLRFEVKREENIKRVLEESIVREGLMKKMAPDRVHLVDGKPCPLCGALQHPYVKYPPAFSNSKQALIDQKAKLRLLVEKVTMTERKILIAGQQVEKKSAKQVRLQLIRGEWLNLCNRLNTVSDELDITQLSQMKHFIKKETAELNELANFITRYRSKQTNIEKLKVSIAKSIAKQESLKASTAQLGVNSEGLNQEQQDLQAALSACQTQEQKLSLKVLEQLTLLGEKMPTKGQEDKLIDRLNVRRQDYHGYTFRHKNLSEEIDALATKQAACATEIAHCNTQLELLGEQLQTQESLSLHLALIEKQKLIADKEQFLAQQEQLTQALHQALLVKIQTSPFKSLQEISDKLELIERQPELERQYAELVQAIDARTFALQAANEQLITDTNDLSTALNSTEVGEQIRRIARKIEINRMEAGQRERLLSEQKQRQQNYDDLLSQLQQQEQVAQPYFADAALLAVEHGMAFRRRVQERVADKLLSQTNALLEKISGRYYLRQIPSEQGLALEVEDTYQGNARRLPKTLSGGESFVVSLALALGLSELANNGRSVDSLFLDEGFGNLDAESLYTVITTLESLQTHGKTVGVISHVEAVQKRFKAQLQVVKKANGLAELRKAF